MKEKYIDEAFPELFTMDTTGTFLQTVNTDFGKIESPKAAQSIIQEWNKMQKALVKSVMQNSFKTVRMYYPPSHVNLIIKDLDDNIYLGKWRSSYNIFDCQSKREDSSKWAWKLADPESVLYG